MAQTTKEFTFTNFEDDPILREQMLAGMGVGGEEAGLENPNTDFAAKAQQDYMAQNQQMLAQGGSGEMAALDKAGAATTTAGMAGANPYVAGAGMAMQGIAAVDSAKRGQEQAKIDAYNKKIMAERSAIRNLFA